MKFDIKNKIIVSLGFILVFLFFSCNDSLYQSGMKSNLSDNVYSNMNMDKEALRSLKQYTENFKFQKPKPLDILIVMDNSGSMGNKQLKTIQGLNNLLSFIKDEDWQIGVITTDSNNTNWISNSNWTNYNHFKNRKSTLNTQCVHDVILNTDPNIQEAFSKAINVGLQGDMYERGIFQAVNGLKSEGCSKWLRDDSVLAVLIVTDERNNGDESDNGCQFKNNPSKNRGDCEAEYLTNYLRQIRPNESDARVYGIFDESKGATYIDAVQQTGGLFGNISSRSFDIILEAISLSVAKDLASEYELARPVDQINKIELLVNHKGGLDRIVLESENFSVNGTKITFAPGVLPKNIEEINFEYSSSF